MNAEKYVLGYELGRRRGESDLSRGTSIHHDALAEGRENATSETNSRPTRAFLLGWLRGYRESVRTFRWGRWGT
jgi:hypothetical protein